MKALLSVSVLLIMVSLVSGCGYSSLKAKDENVRLAWQNVDNACRQRAGLVSEYVELVRAAENRNSDLMDKMNASALQLIRNQNQEIPETVQSLKNYQQSQAELTRFLAMFMAEEERSRRFAADPRCFELYRKLIAGEARLNSAIVNYNMTAHDFNLSRRGVPNLLTNTLFLHYEDKLCFKSNEGVKLVIAAGDRKSPAPRTQAYNLSMN